MKILGFAISHLVALAIGFAGGIYLLPILTAPEAPTASQVAATSAQALFTGQFKRDLADSDALHWGEGKVFISKSTIALEGELAPGPDYKLYLAPEFIDTEAEFKRNKHKMVRVGDVRTFKNFVVDLPESIDPAKYTTVIIWCEAFSEFITAAKYR
jgi:hypothetical protein